ncbi:MAG: replication initiator protein A, partial [Oscillospiraceae bacterium]|nr:replication initiator protein A [Oscillospiraceae bacterium]
MSKIDFDFYYGVEAEQFSFVRIPRVLFTDKDNFGDLSNEAKLLYGLLLERMELSRKNNWIDEHNRVYIIFKIEEIADRMNCGHEKACNIHNHFAVLPYDLDGKHWYANRQSLRLCKKVSDEIAKAHGLSIIEHPKYRPNHKYGEYKSRKEGRSWKQNLCDEIDSLIIKDDVRSIDDLISELKSKGYGINRGKYLAIKVKPNRKAIRTYRLGDGYSLEHLAYRIANKNMEMPLSAALSFVGIQRDYALCIRQIQIQLYRKPESDRLHFVTYREVQKCSELLFYFRKNDIHTLDDFKKTVADADEHIADLKNEKSELMKKIAEEEKLIEDIPKYLEILSRRPLLAKDVKELEKYSYIKSAGVRSAADAEAHREMLAELKDQLGGMADKISDAYEKRKS